MKIVDNKLIVSQKRSKCTISKNDKFDWEKEWKDMPEFTQEDVSAHRQIIVSFKTKEDVDKFSELVKQKLGPKTKSMWFPQDDREKPSLFKYIIEEDGTKP